MENASAHHSEPETNTPDWVKQHRSARRWGGLIIFITGMFLLLQQLHLPIPSWILSWPMYFIILGILFMISSRCHNVTGIIFLLVGGLFLAKDAFGLPAQIYPYIWPALIMFIGLILIFRPYRKNRFCRHHYWEKKFEYAWQHKNVQKHAPLTQQTTEQSLEAIDWFDTTAVFCGMRRKIISKHFKGGDVISLFGGVEIDLTRADVQGRAIIDATVVFGGLRLFVPASWDVQVDMTNVMGGVDDRREVVGVAPDPNKILSLTGAVVMGGVEIRSFPT
jgi:predicted membrane protein